MYGYVQFMFTMADHISTYDIDPNSSQDLRIVACTLSLLSLWRLQTNPLKEENDHFYTPGKGCLQLLIGESILVQCKLIVMFKKCIPILDNDVPLTDMIYFILFGFPAVITHIRYFRDLRLIHCLPHASPSRL